jgi:hypothetical protein
MFYPVSRRSDVPVLMVEQNSNFSIFFQSINAAIFITHYSTASLFSEEAS